MPKDLATMRAQFWADVYVAYVSAANSTNRTGGAAWADEALREFDWRFKSLEVSKAK